MATTSSYLTVNAQHAVEPRLPSNVQYDSLEAPLHDSACPPRATDVVGRAKTPILLPEEGKLFGSSVTHRPATRRTTRHC